MKFDIVVTTYNRKEMICDFVAQVLGCDLLPERIIVVDSSDEENFDVQKLSRVVYVRSSHKNQPYQRYLGLQFVKEEVVVFFDDDVKFLCKDIFSKYTELIKYNNSVASTINFIGSSSINKNINASNKLNKRWFWRFTGAINPDNGKIGLVGSAGIKDENTEDVEIFNGPGGLAILTAIAYEIFRDDLFALFENKMAMGEDKFLGMGVLKYGKIAFCPEQIILHPDHASSYFQNVYSFSRKELYSRLWLSKRYAEVKGVSKWIVYLHFYWYAMCRVIIGAGNFLLRPRRNKWDILCGRCRAIYDTFTIPMRSEVLCKDVDWEIEIRNDINNAL